MGINISTKNKKVKIMGYTNKELQRRIEEKNCIWSFWELKRRKKLEEQIPIIYHGEHFIRVNEIKNNIMNLYGGVKKFVKDYGGDYFDEERVEWFMKNDEYSQSEVWVFVSDWNKCFPK